MPSRSSPMVSPPGFPNIQSAARQHFRGVTSPGLVTYRPSRERPSQWPNEQTGGKSGRSAGWVSRVLTGVNPLSDLLASPPVRQHPHLIRRGNVSPELARP